MKALTQKHNTRKNGFTLLEILAVIIIIGVLGAVIMPNILDSGDKAKVGATKTDMAKIASELDLFKLEVGRYPTTQEGLESLLKNTGGIPNWNGPYSTKKDMKDPWKNDYKYANPGPNNSAYEIKSLGADGKDGGEGHNADIVKS